jgi:hypothetical protein
MCEGRQSAKAVFGPSNTKQSCAVPHPVYPSVYPWHLAKTNGLASHEANPLFSLVRLAGIEPTTPWFVAKYSIQLSYSRQA